MPPLISYMDANCTCTNNHVSPHSLSTLVPYLLSAARHHISILSCVLCVPNGCYLASQVRCQASGLGVKAVVQQLVKASTAPGQTLGALYAGVWSASLCSVVIGEWLPVTVVIHRVSLVLPLGRRRVIAER